VTRLRTTSIYAIALALTACSTTATHVSTSPPNARVVVRAVGSSEKKDVGETPITLSSEQLRTVHKDHGPIVVELSKPGYQTQSVLVTEYSGLDLDIHQDLVPITGVGDSSVVNDAIDRLFEAQRLAKLNRLEEAVAVLNDVEKLSPELSATYELRAGIRYLQKKYSEALEDYTRALQLNPKNAEARRMQEALQALLKTAKAGG
jgi:hypothetical protein